MPNEKLTIGSLVYDDFDGIYFTIQSIRLFHPEVLDRVEFLVIDNNPSSKDGKLTKDFCEKWGNGTIKYSTFEEYSSTSLRNLVFENAQTDYVLCCDCHVMFQPKSLASLIGFFDSGFDGGNLIQGPLLYDTLKIAGTQFDPKWRGGMFGTWGIDKRVETDSYFEIPAQGLGVFACRRDSWLGFNKRFRGFGGEEGYIHEKYRQAGKKTLCLSSLKWLHRFGRPNGTPYPNLYEDRVKNYYIGWLELGLPVFEIIEHFKTLGLSEEKLRQWLAEVQAV